VAERLHLTPAAMSFQTRQRESMSGVTVFERTGKKVALTDAGKVKAHASLVLQTLNDADQTLALKGLSGGRVTFGLVSAAKYFVPHLLALFQSGYPGITIHLKDGNRHEISNALEKVTTPSRSWDSRPTVPT
jgi:DNA-binding transcriptional LysR family regulator